MTKYLVAERFKSLQGEGVYAGTPMAFIRFVGCSVGKKICQHCDTIFERTLPWQGGGEFTLEELNDWCGEYQHICLTGGEPFDQNLLPFAERLTTRGRILHIESSGTKMYDTALFPLSEDADKKQIWLCVSPKPGFLEKVVEAADEVKVIVPGLGTQESLKVLAAEDPLHGFAGPAPKHPLAGRDTFRWPDIHDALRWAEAGKIVFLQPRNGTTEIDKHNLMIVMDLLRDYPQLRLSSQLHKILKVQ